MDQSAAIDQDMMVDIFHAILCAYIFLKICTKFFSDQKLV